MEIRNNNLLCQVWKLVVSIVEFFFYCLVLQLRELFSAVT